MILFFVIELIINDNAIVPADLRSAGIKYKDFFNPLKNTIIRTYSPKGYTSVTVGVAPTACNKANYEHPKLCYIVATTGHKSRQGSRLAQLKIKKVSPAADAKQ